MKSSVLDFIDSETLRLDFSEQTLEPAIECILISQCKCRSLEDKFEALKERDEAYTDEDFEKGVYNVFADDLRSSLRDYIKEKGKFLEEIRVAEDNDIFIINAYCSAIDMSAWKTFDAARSVAKSALDDDQGCVILRRKTDGSSDNVTHIFLNNKKEFYDISDCDDDKYYLSDSYAELPHLYERGDMVRCGDKYAVVTRIIRKKKRDDWLKHQDQIDMKLTCLRYYADDYHTCGGYFYNENFPLLETEVCTVKDIPAREGILRFMSDLLKGEEGLEEFLEEYSTGRWR